MKKIIVPIDFSEHSEFALEATAMLAKKFDAEILALHMLEISEAVLTSASYEQQTKSIFLLELAKKRFNKFLNKDYLKGIKITTIVKHFKVFSEISEVAKKQNVDLIVMGSHGTSGLKEVFIGSNTEKVVRYSDIPVLIIKHHPILLDFENVVFACDFSEEAVKPYANAYNLFSKLGSKLHLVYVNLPDARFRSSSEMEKRVSDFLKIIDGNLDKMDEVKYVNDYSIEKGILNYANVVGADLIAVATHGRKGLSHFFEGSISEDIANHSTLPVMTFKI